MQTLSESECLKKILSEETFEAEIEGGALLIRIHEYVPYICTAIHAGHRLRDTLAQNCLIDEKNRLSEEDPYTDQLIDSFPVILVANDSRYEYDLNRDRDSCIYTNAWGDDVWKTPLKKSEKSLSLKKHDQYYRLLKALLDVLEKKFGGCLLVDIHSYNWEIRKHEQAPIFNIGTAQINLTRFEKPISTLAKNLSAIDLPNLEIETQYDAVFQGKGYQATFIQENTSNTLIIPLEIKKIFMDERSGEPFPLVLEKLQEGLYVSVLSAATVFNKTLKRSTLKRSDLFPSNIEPIVIAIDNSLHRLSKRVETLSYVNPTNLQQEKRRFLSQKNYTPQFRYRQLRIDPYDFKETLYKLPVSDIQDPLIRALYRSVVDTYSTKVEMLSSIGTPQFLYNSLRYYGEPGISDIKNARFLLHANTPANEKEQTPNISADEAKIIFEQAAKDMGLECQVIISTRIVAKAMVDNARRALLINRNACFSALDINALVHHELGVHMVTTLNALEQPLHILSLGLPGNTYTQEGLAILSEHLSGNMNLHRLQQLSLRVLAVDMMVKGVSFGSVYNQLREGYQVSVDEAFSITTRVFRGGGFTKDYLYLSGFRDLVALHKTNDITALLIGKTGLQFHQTLNSLIERNILKKPTRLMPVLKNMPKRESPVLDYLVSSIKAP